MQCLHSSFKHLDWSHHPLKVPSSVPRDLATSFTSWCLAWCDKKTFSMYLSDKMQYSFIYHSFFLFRGSVKIWLLLCKKIWNWSHSLKDKNLLHADQISTPPLCLGVFLCTQELPIQCRLISWHHLSEDTLMVIEINMWRLGGVHNSVEVRTIWTARTKLAWAQGVKWDHAKMHLSLRDVKIRKSVHLRMDAIASVGASQSYKRWILTRVCWWFCSPFCSMCPRIGLRWEM